MILAPVFGYTDTAAVDQEMLSFIQEMVAHPQSYPDGHIFLLLVQGIAATGAFLLVPLLYLFFLDYPVFRHIHFRIEGESLPLFLSLVIVLASIPLNSLVNYWNMHLELPDLGGFQEWAMGEEKSRQLLTDYMTNFNTSWELLLGVVVIALIPGVTEEFLFRGIVQNKIRAVSQSPHLAIWLSAIIFSAIHIQFFGFFPRLLLGALFGYLYYFSANLWVPILAHFVNNLVTLLAIHWYKTGRLDVDVQSEMRPAYSVAMLSLIITGALLYSFYRYYQQTKRGVFSN